jgi:tripartite ATP-independent transporter DctP family solute receptor
MFGNDEGALCRRGFLKMVGVAVGLIAFGVTAASAAPGAKVARLASVVAPGGAVDRACNDFAKIVAQKSKGQLTVQIFPGGQLGGERDMVESVQLGAIEIGVFGSYVIANVTPEWGLPIDTPYAMRNQEHFRKVVDGPLAKPMYDAMLQRKGIRHVAWANRGPRYLTSNKPVKTPADLKGVKIRVPEVETYLAAWKMLGATVTPMAFPEVFMALKQGTIDAQENPLELILTSSFYEVQKYVNLTAHICSGYEITVSQRWLKTLSPALQKIVIDGLVEMGKIEDRYQAADEAELQRKLKAKGMIFNPVDLPKFQEALKDLPNQFKDKWKPGFAEEIKAVR